MSKKKKKKFKINPQQICAIVLLFVVILTFVAGLFTT
jgi:hypothetical protein